MTTWSGWSKPYGDSRAMKVGVDAWISSSNDTQAYITVKAMATSGSAGSWEAAYQYGVVTQDGHGAASNRGADWNEAGRGVLNAGDTIAQGQHTYGPFNRTTSAYSVACWGKAWGETVNGYGAWAGNAEVFVNVTIPALPVYAPNPVTGLSASRASDTRMNLSWTNHPDTTHPYTSILVERQIDNGSWAQIASIGGGSASHADSTTTAGHVYRYRVRSSNASGTSAYATSGFTYTTPPACSACTNTRVSDTKNTVSWKLGTSVSGLYATIKVERSMDGGSWAEIASVSGSATSYADTGTSSNHAYAYRVRANNAAGYSGYAASSTTYNTPTEPSNVVAARKTETVVTVTMDNPALTATAAEVQRSPDAATWATIRTITSANVTSFDDTPGGGTFYYRVRNTRGSLASAWSAASNKVITIIAPAAPTLNEPASGVVVPKTQQSVHFAWTHNPIDGSPQSKAEIATSTDGGATWTTSVVSDSKTAADLANGWSINATVTWRVRTKGAHADFGAWSNTRAFRVCQMPSVSVSSPAVDGQALTDVPVRVAWTYNDPSGTQQQATVTVKSADGFVLFTRTIAGATASLDIGTKDMLPKNNSTFTITVAVVSTSSLASSATRTFTTNYLEPAVPEIIIEQDSVNGRVSATCFSGDRDGDNLPDTASLGIFRRNADGRLVPIVDKVVSGTGAVDCYPPLDQPLSYIATAYTDNGLTSEKEVVVTVPSRGFVFVNFDAASGYADVAKMAMDVEWNTDRQPDSEIIDTEGSEDPLVFYGSALQTSTEISGSVWWRTDTAPEGWSDAPSMAAAFERLAKDRGIKIVRYPHGDVEPAHLTCKLSTSSANPLVNGVELSGRKVRAHGLVL